MSAGKQQFRGRDVLAQRPDMLVGWYRRLDLDRSIVDLVYDLDHDDGVEPVRNRVAGVDQTACRPMSSRTGEVSVAPTVSRERTAAPSIADES